MIIITEDIIKREFKNHLIEIGEVEEHSKNDFEINLDGSFHVISLPLNNIFYRYNITVSGVMKWDIEYFSTEGTASSGDIVHCRFDITDIKSILSETENAYLKEISEKYKIYLPELEKIVINIKNEKASDF